MMTRQLERRQFEEFQERQEEQRQLEHEQQRIHEARMDAAEEMYEALKVCIEVMEEMGGCKSERHQAEAAVAKAEGRQ